MRGPFEAPARPRGARARPDLRRAGAAQQTPTLGAPETPDRRRAAAADHRQRQRRPEDLAGGAHLRRGPDPARRDRVRDRRRRARAHARSSPTTPARKWPRESRTSTASRPSSAPGPRPAPRRRRQRGRTAEGNARTARHVDVARAQRAALGRQARAVQAHEGQRDAALALAGRVATPDVGEALEVERGDEREAQAPDRLAGPAGHAGLDGDAVVAADRPCSGSRSSGTASLAFSSGPHSVRVIGPLQLAGALARPARRA